MRPPARCAASAEYAHAAHVQVVPFHPAATYSEAPGLDAADFATRSPVPLLHLLRQSDVEAAEAAHPDSGGIATQNAARLRGEGAARLAALLAACG